MSDLDQLESLSNQELRAKCLEHGLPNVPVTDSSRKVLIKKLRLILSDPAAAAASKKTNRRETIHGTAALTPSKQSAAVGGNEEERGTPGRTSRRTIAAPAVGNELMADKSEVDKPEGITARRRSTSQKTVTDSVGSEDAAKPMAALAKNEAANVKERRRSVRDRESMEKLTQQSVKIDRPVTIIEDDEHVVVPERRTSAVREVVAPQYTATAKKVAPILEAGSVVILESDDEEDDDLVRAAEQIENRDKITTAARMGRGSSLSKSNTVTTSYAHAATATAASTQQQQPIPEHVQFTKPYPSMSSNTRNFPSSQPLAATERNIYSGAQTQSARHTLGYAGTRYGSALPTTTAYSSPSYQRYSTSAATSSTSPFVYKPSVYTNEQSDDTEPEAEQVHTPFLSSFARNLERIKADKLSPSGVKSPRYRGSRLYDEKTNTYTRQAHDADNSYFMKLERKYHLTFFFLLIGLTTILVAFYYFFFN